MQSNRILMLEADKAMMHILLGMLDMHGYDLQPAYSAQEALGYLEREQFSALIADVGPPGMTGIELAQKVFSANPSAQIIFTAGSGYLILRCTLKAS
jgi:DNA-binding response OmpR family regulator